MVPSISTRKKVRSGWSRSAVKRSTDASRRRASGSALFEGRRPMRILLEASTESEWVAQHLETLGHEVIVADPSFAPMYSERSRTYQD
jgi:transposase